MQRRTFIQLSAYTALVLTIPFVDGCTPSTEDVISQPLLFSHLADAKTIKEAGDAYRKLVAKEDNKMVLKQLLIGDGTSPDKSSIQKILDNRVFQDFKSGKTIAPAGWVLSITEARQCALYSILNA